MIKLIKTEQQHEQAMQRLLELAELDLETNRDAADEFELLSVLVDHYESQCTEVHQADPIEIIRFYMEQHNLTHKDMQPYLGSKGTVSKILNYKAPLTLSKIWKLNEELGIPVEILAQKYQIQQKNIKETILETFHKAFELVSSQKNYQFTTVKI
ncbi:type II toxin-antitoxin system HigA family antitoxin [Aggregatibacter sp. Marseille-P9115]|jgi:putative transcription regulator with HTH domain protein|uniref:helix-turn-helix domain-containing protein n=1 Tax=Aggregatibacter sp. Marseille-P9115 TaxID=2866570 RepID=UPI001E43D3A0|nr:helix-turn-helix domain-containing protein [Aggregatibacter sp. Marseille-P9115]DAX67945.1 MAG TPA: putative transcriptional regulator [Caudoviricetes sp.]